MSTSEASSLRRFPSPTKIKAEHTISLIDRTTTHAPSNRNTDAEQSDSDPPTAPPTPGLETLSKRLTNNSVRQTVRQQYTKQKYSKYSQDRYHIPESSAVTHEEAVDTPQIDQAATSAQKTYYERAQTKAKDVLRRKRTLGRGDKEDRVVDVLYENQRGVFFFGVPKYSSASLLPCDPRSWQNGQFRTSAVDIRNAQVPDPSWEWAWPSWYVDMDRDVDEEGWEYTFAFVGRGAVTFAWHGNHPWFHSFVRRRRWLRMRKRRDLKHHTQERGHELGADYFTIHPKTVRPSSLLGSQHGSSAMLERMKQTRNSELDFAEIEISSIGDLQLALRRARVDRDKILAVKKFIGTGGEELYYLSDRMDEIMSTLIYQSSRRQLLGNLAAHHDQAHKEQKSLAQHQHDDDDIKQQEHDRAARRADNILKAVHAADEHVKKLEYWSDIRGLTDAISKAEHEEAHPQPSFKNKQDASAPAPKLHKHAEHALNAGHKDTKSAYRTVDESAALRAGDLQETQAKPSKGKGRAVGFESDLERYTTAPETPQGASKSKGKDKARALNGVTEATEEEDSTQQIGDFQTSQPTARRSVQIVEPVPQPISEQDDPAEYDGENASNDEEGERYEAHTPPDRGEAKTPDSVANLMRIMKKPKNWLDQAFG